MKNIFKFILSALVAACTCLSLQAFTLKITNKGKQTVFYRFDQKTTTYQALPKGKSATASYAVHQRGDAREASFYFAFPKKDTIPFRITVYWKSALFNADAYNNATVEYIITDDEEEFKTSTRDFSYIWQKPQSDTYWFNVSACVKLGVSSAHTSMSDLPYLLLGLDRKKNPWKMTITSHYNDLKKLWTNILVNSKNADERTQSTQVLATLNLAYDALTK